MAIFQQMADAVQQGRFAEAEALAAEFSQRPQPPTAEYRPGGAEFWRSLGQFFQGKLTDAEWQTGYDLTVRHRNVSVQHEFLALRAESDLCQDRPARALEAIEQALQITKKLGAPRRDYHDLRAWALARAGRTADAQAELQAGAQGVPAAEATGRSAITNGRRNVRSRLIAGPGAKGRRILIGTTWSAAGPS